MILNTFTSEKLRCAEQSLHPTGQLWAIDVKSKSPRHRLKHPEKLNNLLWVTQWHQDSTSRLGSSDAWPHPIEVLTPHKAPCSLMF